MGDDNWLWMEVCNYAATQFRSSNSVSVNLHAINTIKQQEKNMKVKELYRVKVNNYLFCMSNFFRVELFGFCQIFYVTFIQEGGGW